MDEAIKKYRKIIIVTGGTKGIGYATAKKFLEMGNTVVIASNYHGQETDNIISELKKVGDASFVSCNVAKKEECENVVKYAIEKYGQVDVLANVAGIVGKRVSFLDNDLSDTENVINVNIMGTLNISYFVAKEMVKRKYGVVINVGSICGFMANTEAVGYHASKGGVKMATQSMARELGVEGIRVLSIAPAWVNTGMIEQEIADFAGKMHLKGRVIEPVEIANAIYLMSLDEASAINGTTIMVDDGYTSFKGLDIEKIN